MVTVELQPRDIELLAALFQCRIMTLAHAVELFFDGKAEMGKKRVQKLKAAGFLRERRRLAFHPSVLSLASGGLQALREAGTLAEYTGREFDMSKRVQVSEFTVAHELEVMDIRVALTRAIRSDPRLSIIEFGTWPTLFEFEAQVRSPRGWTRSQAVRPDGFCRIQERTEEEISEHSFFIEVDRSTETQERLAHRCAAYQTFYRSGGLAEWFGASPEEYKAFPFRVLVIVKTEERRNNLLHFCLQQKIPIHQLVWTSTLEEVRADPLKPIWVCPADYAKALEGSRFDPENIHPGFFRNYRRQTEREATVEARVAKRLLIP